MKTYSPKPDHIERRWYVLDANEQVLGRVASEAAVILRGKHKPIYAPHMDVGDHVIVVNAAKVVLTGGKESKKVAWRHSGHPGGITGTLYEDLLATKPAFAVEKAVRGMLPKNRLGRAMIKKLHVVPGPEHRHQAQKPVDWTMGTRPAWEGLPQRSAPVTNGGPVGESKPVPTEDAGSAATTSAAKTTARKPAARKPTGGVRPTAARKTTATKKTTATTKTTAAKTTRGAKPTASKKTAASKRTAAARKTAATKTSTPKKET
jgi:large subunit ribosomal protein L13